MSQKILNITEASVMLSRSEDWTRKHAANGFIKGTKINERSWVFFEADLLEHIKQNTKSFNQLQKELKESASKDVSQSRVDSLSYLMQKVYGYSQSYPSSRNIELAVKYLSDEIKYLEGCVAANGGV